MKGIRLRTSLRRLYLAVLFLHLVFIGPPGPRIFLLGVSIVLLGRALQAWSYGHLRKINERRGPTPLLPTTSGPYSRLRNPIAWSSFISDLGFGVLAGAPIPTVAYAFLYWPIAVRRILRYEEPMLGRRCGGAYEAYREAVPRFLPRLSSYTGTVRGRFSIRVLWENGEVSRLIGALSLIAIFRVASVIREGGVGGSPDFWIVAPIAVATGVASLVLQGIEYRPHLARRRVLRWLKGMSSSG